MILTKNSGRAVSRRTRHSLWQRWIVAESKPTQNVRYLSSDRFHLWDARIDFVVADIEKLQHQHWTVSWEPVDNSQWLNLSTQSSAAWAPKPSRNIDSDPLKKHSRHVVQLEKRGNHAETPKFHNRGVACNN